MATINLGRVVGYSAYEIAVQNGFDGTEEEWLESLKGEQGVNPFKGWWPSFAALKDEITAMAGDFAYVIPAVATDPVSIYEYDSTATTDNYWHDSGRTFNPANNQEFASGEALNEVHIVDDYSTGGIHDVLSAEQGVKLKNMINSVVVEVSEEGFYVVDEQLNIGFSITSTGAHAFNLMEYELINIE